MAANDVTGIQWRHNPQYLPYLVEHITGYLLKVKSFRNVATKQRPKERGGDESIDPPCTKVRVRVCLYARGLSSLNSPYNSFTATIFCFSVVVFTQTCSTLKYSKSSFSFALWTFPNAPWPNASMNSVLIGGISQGSNTWMSFAVLKKMYNYWSLF